ncbi:NAD(P)H-hydrate dehydratase [Flavobacterium magnum]|uniref:ADP-dependent (S)-NAD(P)H-hydrate dehydratase n=1 Tax=Flavobacterium magnum TaxID=2162713 RepID=A0A2S0RHH6_9FLAO|nr:NAD(P)H-hydrate dehydratase [Flavobacterium magnum]AWA30678.1 NAD(P)H-hydrate dehydratase [Flavobacterium magnum]
MKTITVTSEIIRKIYRPAGSTDHKGTRGDALIIGGSYGKIGAVSLSAKAALKSGCGLVTAYVPKCGYDSLQASIPEVMVVTDINRLTITNIQLPIKPQAIGIGPGMGQEAKTKTAFYKFLKTNEIPLVIDADGLNMLSSLPKSRAFLTPGTILTPHPKELERLLGKRDTRELLVEEAIAFSKRYEVVMVLKGAPTRIVDGDTVYENTTGNAALATAGSGDVLTGIITSLRAQGYLPVDAAVLGVYLHGLTADIALPETGTESFIASDIISTLGKAFLSIAT